MKRLCTARAAIGSAAIGMMLCGCGEDSLETITMADESATGGGAGCPADGDAQFTLRVIYNVIDSYERDALKNKGAPAQAKGITRSELLIRDQATLVRRTGKTYIQDPQKWSEWADEGEKVADEESTEAFVARGRAWQDAEQDIPMKTVPIEWVDLRAPAGQYSYRYGLDPMVPLQGEKWREDERNFDLGDLNAALFDQQFVALDPSVMEGVEVSESSFGGVKCEMLRKRIGARVHETCYANLGGHTVVLHGMDKTPDGLFSQTAISVEQGLCVPDHMLAAPGRVKFEDVSG